MKLIKDKIKIEDLRQIAKEGFGNFIKAVVDIEFKIMAIDAELHADEEAQLLSEGSKQENLWGINLYPEIKTDDWIEFDSLINVRPVQNNLSRGVVNEVIRKKIIEVVNNLIIR